MKSKQWIKEKLASIESIKRLFNLQLDEELAKKSKMDKSIIDIYRTELLCANTEIDLLNKILED